MALDPILIVDDNPLVRDVLARRLRSRGFTTVQAEGGAAALAQLRAGGPWSVILLDMMMPDVDGYQFRAAQLGDPQLRDIPVIVVSAAPLDQARAAGLALDDVVTKPVDLDRLVALICRYSH